MSGYLYFNRTGNKVFDDVLSMIEQAGTAYHHTEWWQEENEPGEPTYLERINALIDVAREEVKKESTNG